MLARHARLLLAASIAMLPWCARAADPGKQLTALFDAGRKSTPPAVATARQHAVQLKRDDRDDLSSDSAYGGVLANQRRYADAAKLFARYLAEHPGHLPAQRLTIWTQIQDKNFDAALTTIDALGQAFAMPDADQPPDAYVETARFLGVCFGYLELVGASSLDGVKLSARKNALLKNLGEQYTPSFDEGRQEVATQLRELEAKRDARLTRAEEQADKQREQAEEALDQKRDQIAAQREASQASAEQLRDAQREYGLLEQQLRPMLRDRAVTAAQMAMLWAQMTEIFAADERLAGQNFQVGPNGVVSVDPLTGRQTRTARNNFDSISDADYARAIGLSIAIGGLTRQAFEMDRQIVAMRTQMFQLAGHGEAEARKMAESQAAADKAAERADRLEKRLSRDEPEKRTRPAGPTGRMARFTTYAPFPYEQETARVLGWFGQ